MGLCLPQVARLANCSLLLMRDATGHLARALPLKRPPILSTTSTIPSSNASSRSASRARLTPDRSDSPEKVTTEWIPELISNDL
jgi:hypothetical protein